MPSHSLSTDRQRLIRIAFLGALVPWSHALATAKDWDGNSSAEKKAISLVGADTVLSEEDIEAIQNLIREDRYDDAEAIVEERLRTIPMMDGHWRINLAFSPTELNSFEITPGWMKPWRLRNGQFNCYPTIHSPTSLAPTLIESLSDMRKPLPMQRRQYSAIQTFQWHM